LYLRNSAGRAILPNRDPEKMAGPNSVYVYGVGIAKRDAVDPGELVIVLPF
jgi:hypothetical protein